MSGVDDATTSSQRAAHNQSLFRMINEQIRKLQGEHGLADDFGPHIAQCVCECANAGCLVAIQLSDEEYVEVRAASHRFAVAPGPEHVFAEVEDVTARHLHYWVVEKTGPAREIAAAAYRLDVGEGFQVSRGRGPSDAG